jgi:hypothetical protein
MNLSIKDLMVLLHPAIAVIILFPLLGIVVNRAVLVRLRRQEVRAGDKSKIAPSVGVEHVKWGKYLANVTVGITLLGLLRPTFESLWANDIWHKKPILAVSIVLMYGGTIATFSCIDRAKQGYWRAIFATLTSMGLIILGSQDGVYRREKEWFVSHFYYGLGAAILTICAMAMLPEIHRDRTNRWRNAHIILNCIALLFFIIQGLTGVRDLLEIPLSQ